MTIGQQNGPAFAGVREDRLTSYCRPYRKAVQLLASQSARLGDLATSFPGLLFAIATEYGSDAGRAAACRMIEEGAPLRQAAKAIGLPWWMRRLPPEAFDRPLHTFPDDAEFARGITGIIGAGVRDPASWLYRLGLAYEAAGPAFALWLARQRRMPASHADETTLSLLAAWAWHSGQPHTPGYRILDRRWSETMGYRLAVQEARAWAARIDLAVALGPGIDDTWLQAGACNGFEFVPLRTLDDFIGEATRMRNCLDRYGDQVRLGTTRVFSIRKAGRQVADLEIRPHSDDGLVPEIVQLRGPRNRRAAPEVWQAAYAWLAGQTYRPFPQIPAAGGTANRTQQLARAVWRPYLDHVKGRRCERAVHRLVFADAVPEQEAGTRERRGRPAAARAA